MNRNTRKPGRRKPSGNPRNNRGGQKKSNLNPALLVRKAIQKEETQYIPHRTFDEMPIDSRLKQALSQKGFTHPTEIQDQTIEPLLEGRDILGIAQTGSGKTGGFLIPVIQKLIERNTKPYALILVPTRELAVQIEDEFKSMTKGLKLYSSCFIGGTNVNRDVQELRRSSHVVIATPGRLLDLKDRGAIDLGQFHTLILDEFDRMLDMGFVHDVKKILSAMDRRKHTMLFSATLDKTQKEMIGRVLKDPVTVKVSNGETTGDHIDQEIITLQSGENKFEMLCGMLSDDEFEKVLVFDEAKHRVKKLCKKLNSAGFKAGEIHGNRSQSQRQAALDAFKKDKTQVLVATDVAARGIDVSDVTHVINYQVPMTYDSYIHRIGRTGRAGKAGKAFTFVD